MYKIVIAFASCMMLFGLQQLLAQPSVNIKHKIEAVEGTNLLRHGDYNYEFHVEQGKLSSATFNWNLPMVEIIGEVRTDIIRRLLGAQADQYRDLACDCLSLWQIGNTYTILEVSNEARREKYTIHYHIIEE